MHNLLDYIENIIINITGSLLGQGATTQPITLMLQEPLLLWTTGGLILLNLLSDSMNAVTNLVFSSLRDRIQGFVQGRVLDKVANFADTVAKMIMILKIKLFI